MSNQQDTRSVMSLRPGTRVALMVAAGFLAVAAYFYLTPTMFMGKDGGLFGCGSPMSPNSGNLGKDQCSIVEGQAANRAYLFAALAVLTAVLGALFFGSDHKAQERVDRRARYEDDDDAPRRSSVLAGRSERQTLRDEAPSRRRHEDDDEPLAERPRRRPRLGDEDFDGVDDADDADVRPRRRLSDD